MDQATATLAAACATFVVGIIVAIVASLQYRVARAKFRLDLYDRRLRFYVMLVRLTQPGHASLGSDAQDITAIMLESQFLFGPEVQAFLNEKSLAELSSLQEDEKSDPKGAAASARNRSRVKWATDLTRNIRPYMDFSDWR